jgi:uncharacterized protein with ParB-like and HNH nuclease domain
MRVDPEHAAVGKFFGRDPMFRVPKYQRSYAWETDEVEDFIKDLTNCYIKRKSGAGKEVNHFFGGVVSVEKKVTGVVQQHEYELVDGQQRFATFVLLVSSIISVYKLLLVEAKAVSDSNSERIIEKRIVKLCERFIEFEQEINQNTFTVNVLELSKADKQFFNDLIHLNNPTPSRDSHRRLKNAFDLVKSKVNELIATTNISDKLNDLEEFQKVIDNDFTLIHIITYDQTEAYRLFQVLNDRGKSLTEGDLLRAKTLEILEGFQTEQRSAEGLWDEILKDSSKVTDNYLRWIYASHQGNRPGSNTLFDDFLNKFFPQHGVLPLDRAQAIAILETIKKIKIEIEIARKISDGAWPFITSAPPITAWDKNRLDLLIRELGFTVTLPILLASYNLGEKKFSEIVQLLERFLFRYKTVANEHIEAVVTILHTNSVAMRLAPTTYSIDTLKTSLRTLLAARVNDTHFRSSLDTMSYKEGGGNKPIKYFLITLEHYKRWANGTATTGEPKCMDKTRIYDFSSTTIEHVYPRNAHGPVIDATLEPLKNEMENLTMMGPTDNGLGGNNNFATKKTLFLASSVTLNLDIGNLPQWTTAELAIRKDQLKDMACKIFKI